MAYIIRTPQSMPYTAIQFYKHGRMALVRFENGFECYMIGAKLKLNIEGLV